MGMVSLNLGTVVAMETSYVERRMLAHKQCTLSRTKPHLVSAGV